MRHEPIMTGVQALTPSLPRDVNVMIQWWQGIYKISPSIFSAIYDYGVTLLGHFALWQEFFILT
jgi:hypothetical protein